VAGVTAENPWLDALWPFVRDHLPPAPGRVVEIGCGPLGGVVNRLQMAGYDAVGVDPEAPEGPRFHRSAFERYTVPLPFDAVVASLSLHHVADPAVVLDKVARALVAAGTIVVIEWARERVDEATARWCFTRLPQPPPGEDPGWLARRRDEWVASGQPWDEYREAWAQRENMHSGRAVLDALDRRFHRQSLTFGPYFFPDLADTTAADEQAAIDGAVIQATCIRYTGRLR
jgi:SAM-dependent methyltransferase